MQKLKKVTVMLGIIISIILINGKVKATNISVSPENPKVGDKITITVTVPGVHTSTVFVKVSGVVSGEIKVVGGDLAGEVRDFSKSATYTCNSAGTINIKTEDKSTAVLNGEYINVSASKTINVVESSNNGNGGNSSTGNSSSNNNSNNTDNTPKVSSDATLKNLGINPKEYDFKGFKKATTSYDVSVPNEASSITIYATANSNKAKVEGIGKKELKEGQNSFEIKVTAEDGKTTKKYTLNITRKTAEESSNTNTENEENNETEESNKNIIGLTGLEVKGFKISPEFSNDIYEYNLELNKDLSELEIIPSVSGENIKVDITGNSELQEGENTITLLVHNSETDETTTYQIIVNKKVSIDLTAANEASKEAAEKMKKQKMMILGIVGFIVIASIVFIIIKIKLKNKNNVYEKKSKVDEEERIDLDNQNDKDLFNRVNKKEEIQENPKREFEALNVRLNEKVQEEEKIEKDDIKQERYIENNALDDFENMDNLEEFLRKMKEDK